MTRSARIVLLGSLLWWCAGTLPTRAAPAQVSPARQASVSLPPTDFPPRDIPIWRHERQGLAAKTASERLVETRDSPDLIELLATQDRTDDALKILSGIVSGPVGSMAPAFAAVVRAATSLLRDQSRGHAERLRDLVASARARLSELPREDAARLARQLLEVDNLVARGGSQGYALRLGAFLQQYAGTEEASFAEVDLMESPLTGSLAQRIEALDAFARAHPGTVVGAKARYVQGFQLRANAAITGFEPRGSDPTDRFVKVLGIVNELESGSYPRCEWVEKAPSLIIGFFTSQPKYSAEHLDTVIDAYRRFVAAHFTIDDESPLANTAGYVITTKMAELYKLKGVGAAGVLQTLTELEQDVTDPSAVRYLAALYYASDLKGEAPPSEHGALIRRSNEMLLALATEGGVYSGKALATLASQQFYERDYVHAIETYQKYLTAFPQSTWAWVAAVRIGQSQAELGNWKAAIASFRRAASAYASLPMARVMGYAHAARANEALGQFDEALADNQRALQAWDSDYGRTYPFSSAHAPAAGSSADTISADVVKDALMDRVVVLSQSLKVPGGDLLERGRWLLQQHKWSDARATLEQLATRYPRSPAASEAGPLAHQARLEHALELADVEMPTHDEGAAVQELVALARERPDFSVSASMITRAAILWKQGAATGAQALMTEALSGWRAQQPTSAQPAKGTVEEDVMAIRDAVFRPTGGGVYGTSDWNAFSWPKTTALYVVMNPELSVEFSTGEMVRVKSYRALPDMDNVLFFNSDQIRFFSTMIGRLGGNRRGRPTSVMATPDQPVGPSLDILALLNQFFAARPSHWGGWEFATYPVIGRVEFLNPERTRATAAVTIGYSGATVVLEKKEGVWTTTGLTNRWVT